MGIETDITAFDVGIGQMPEAVIKVYGGAIVKEIFNPCACLQNKFERGRDFHGPLKKITPSATYPGKQEGSPRSVAIEKLVFQL